MNENYWKKFYAKFKCKEPSDFAKFCARRISKKQVIIDVGCGNMRDSKFFAAKKYTVVPVDRMAVSPDCNRSDAVEFLKKLDGYYKNPAIYARFFLHAIEKEELQRFLKLVCDKGFDFYAEARSDKDENIKQDKSHKRNLINAHWLAQYLLSSNYDLVYFTEGKGMAKWKSEDPIVIRLIAKRR